LVEVTCGRRRFLGPLPRRPLVLGVGAMAGLVVASLQRVEIARSPWSPHAERAERLAQSVGDGAADVDAAAGAERR
jgi:hypothetical protein